MPWMGIDDQMHANRKFRKLRGDRWACTGYWVTCGSWCAQALTDGFIPDYVLEDWDPDHRMSRRLVDVQLWTRTTVGGDDGYQFHDWEQSNLSAEKIKDKRRAHADRQERYRERERRKRLGLPPEDPTDGPGDTGSSDPSPVTSRNSHVRPAASGDASRDTSPDAAPDAARDPSGEAYRDGPPIPSHPIPSPRTTKDTADAGASAPSTAPPSRPRARPTAVDPQGFAEFWTACPRKIGKGAARTAYAKAIKRAGITPESVTAAMERAALFWRRTRTEERFVPHPATWLNQGRYEDPTPEPSTDLAEAAGGYRGIAPSGRIPTTTQRIADIQALKGEFR